MILLLSLSLSVECMQLTEPCL